MHRIPQTVSHYGRAWRVAVLSTLALVAAILFAGLVVLQVRTERVREQAVERQSHSYELLVRIATLAATLAKAEAALGRYAISADAHLGQDYARAWNNGEVQIGQLRSLLAHNPEQEREIAALTQDFRARSRELESVATRVDARSNSAALRSYYAIRDTDALHRLRGHFTHLLENERAHLSQRANQAATAIANANRATRVLAAFGAILALAAILLGWFTVQAMGERGRADADADAERERAATLEAVVEEATAQLRAEARDREEAEAKLRQMQKMEAVGQLTGGIAHDFNNMLAIVRGGLELARRQVETGGGDTLRHINNAMEGADRAAALTRRLLAFSRAEPLLPEPVSPIALIDGMKDLLDRTLGDTIEILVRDDGAGWNIWIDRHQLENALINLAVNARDAMNGRGTLTLATRATQLTDREVSDCPAGDYVAIRVSDTGCGMAPDILERVFEPFFTTKPVGRGTGLGLSQIFGFVRQSGGGIALDSTPGEGTHVTLYFPRYRGAAVPVELSTARRGPATARRALHILVVVDDPRVLNATVNALTELGHRPVPCPDPLAAPAALAAMLHCDLILSDVLMPGQTGPEMVAALERAGKLRDMRVLFVTGFAGEADPTVFGGRQVLRKPFTLAALARAVDSTMAAPTMAPVPSPE